MTNNTIANVPRELLADLLGNDHDKRIMAERHLLAMLANAPSPAGVGGLDVVGWYTEDHLDDKSATTYSREVADHWLAKGWPVNGIANAADAQAIIDGLRGEVADLRTMLATVSKAGLRVRTERDQQAQRIGELEGLLRDFAYHTQRREMPTESSLAEWADRIDAALSAGKEGE